MEFIEFDIKVLEEKLNHIRPDSEPLWGKMSANQMLNHLIDVTKVSNGKVNIGFANKLENLPKLRHILFKEVPFPKEFAAPAQVEEMILKSEKVSLDDLKPLLLAEIKDFETHFTNDEQTVINAVFGPLTKSDWIWFHRKHISHHFAQFGLWSY